MTLLGIDIGWALFLCLGAVFGVVLTFMGWHQEYQEALAAARNKAVAELAQREQALNQRQAEIEHWRRTLERQFEADRAESEQLRAVAREEQGRLASAIHAATTMSKDLPKGSGHEAISARLRELHLSGFVYGPYITVQFIGSIDGFFRLRWTLHFDRPQPPKLVILRDNKSIRESVSFSGEHGDQLNPGKRYVYAFRLFDHRGKQLGEDILTEVRIPTSDVWATDVGALARTLTSDAERDAKLRRSFARKMGGLKLVHELAHSAHAEIDRWKVTDDIKEWAKAQVDALGARLRDGGGEE